MAVPTVAELVKVFDVYLNEIDLCRARHCHFAMLHILVCIPDMCGTLADQDGNGQAADYTRWCDTYLKTLPMNGAERWELRNKLLHRGWSTPVKAGRYSNYVFGEAGSGTRVSGNVLLLDIDGLRKETLAGLDLWWNDVATSKAQGYQYVQQNMGNMVGASALPVWRSSTTGEPQEVFVSVTTGQMFSSIISALPSKKTP